MILLNVSRELLSAAEALAHPSAGELVNWCDHFAGDIMERFIGPDGTIRELLPETKNKDNCILGRYVNPGHSLRHVVLMHYALTLGKEREKEIIDLACSVVERAFELGWDRSLVDSITLWMKRGQTVWRGGKFANHP